MENINLSSLVKVFYDRKRLLISSFVVLSLTTISVLLYLPNWYQSKISLRENIENQNEIQGILSSVSSLSSLGSFASFQSNEKTDYAIELLKSKDFASRILRNDNFREKIYAAESYDFENKKIVFDGSMYDANERRWVRKISSTKYGTVIPSDVEIYEEYLQKHLFIIKNRETGFIQITFEHVSPIFVKEFLDTVIFEINDIVKKADQAEAERALLFLEEKLENTENNEVRESLNNLIEIYLKKELLLNVSKYYMLEPIYLPYIPQIKSWPSRSLLTVVIISLSMLVLMIAVLIIDKRKFNGH